MSLREALDSLPQLDRDSLFVAFEQGRPSHIKLQDNTFVGVNLQGDPNFEILQSYNQWSFGIMKGIKS